MADGSHFSPEFSLSGSLSDENALLQQYGSILENRSEAFFPLFLKKIKSSHLANVVENRDLDRMHRGVVRYYKEILTAEFDETRQIMIHGLSDLHRNLGLSVDNLIPAYDLIADDLDQGVRALGLSSDKEESLRRILRKRLHLDMTWHMQGLLKGSDFIATQNTFYRAILEINGLFSDGTGLTEPECFSLLSEILVREIGLSLCYIGLVSSHQSTVEIASAVGPSSGYAEGLRLSVDPALPEGNGPVGRALRSGKIEIVDSGESVYSDPRFLPWKKRLEEFGLGGIAAIPFSIAEGRRGVIALYRKTGSRFPKGIDTLLKRLAKDLGAFLEHRRRAEELRNLSSLYQALMSEGDILLKARNDRELMVKSCRRLTESGLFIAAWIGCPDAKGFFKYLASAGPGAQSLAALHLPVSETQGGLSLAARTYREGRLHYENELSSDILLAPWKEFLNRARWRSAATLPLNRQGQRWGVLSVVSDRAGIFEPGILKLLVRISQLISHGLDELDLKKMLAQERDRHQYLAMHDSLTGLPNRSYFEQLCMDVLALTKREGKHLALGILDLDGFKEWNDTLGHKAGDLLLKDLARALRENMRQGEGLARLGGDEFGLFFSVNSPDDLEIISDRVLKTVLSCDIEGRITGSLGWGVCPWDGTDYDTLLSHADEAMYFAKSEGKNTARIFHRDVVITTEWRKTFDHRFREAVKKGDLQFFLHPQSDCRKGVLKAVEMLVRWNTSDRLLMPKEFIPDVERNPDLIRLLGCHVLQKAVLLRRRLRDAGRPLGVSFNIGARHFLHPAFLEDVEEALAGEGGDGLTIEITEVTALEDLPKSVSIMRGLKKKGFQFSIDDFGIGYSSLHYVSVLPADVLKLDQSFIRGIRDNPSAFAVAGSAIVLSQLSGKTLVAEGIEFAEDLEVWLRMGGSVIQGFLLSPPVPEETFFRDWKRILQSFSFDSLPMFHVEDLSLLGCIIHSEIKGDDYPDPIYYREEHCPLCSWFDNRRDRYGIFSEFEEAQEIHKVLHRAPEIERISLFGEHYRKIRALYAQVEQTLTRNTENKA